MNSKAQVLYVDDEKANLTSFKYAFHEDYDIYTAISAKEGLKLLSNKSIDVIISDQRMPEVTGVELLEQVKELYPDSFRLILTGYSDISAVIKAINQGHVYYYLSKPWKEEEIRMVIANAREAQFLEKKNIQLTKALYQSKKDTESALLKLKVSYDEIKQRKDELDMLIDSSPEAIIMTDQDGVVLRSNVTARLISGYTDEELSGASIETLLPERFRKQHSKLRNSYLRMPSSRAMGEGQPLFLRKKNGDELVVDISLSPLVTNDNKYVLVSIRDMSERHQIDNEISEHSRNLELRVRQRTKELEQINKSMSRRLQFDSLIVDVSTRFISMDFAKIEQGLTYALEVIASYIQAGSGYILNFSKDTQSIKMTNYWAADNFSGVKEIIPKKIKLKDVLWWKNKIRSGEEVVVSDISTFDNDSEKISVIASESGVKAFLHIPLKWQNSVIGVLGFTCDHIRDWKDEDIMLLRVLAQMFSNLLQNKKTNEEIIAARDEAEHANRAKGTFLATMSHEIRTPMNGVVGMIDMLTKTDLTDEQKEMLHTIRNSSFTLLQVINDILDFSKIEAGKMRVENIPFKLYEVIECAVESLRITALDNNVVLDLFIDPEIPHWLIGDPLRVRQVMVNIVSNAVKFSKSKDLAKRGYVLVKVTRVQHNEKSTIIHFSVKDTGIGISKQQLKQLFKPFSQAETTTTRRFGGSGLGLSICKQLIDIMGGEISVVSQLGKGAEFNIRLEFMRHSITGFNTDTPDYAGIDNLSLLLVSQNQCTIDNLQRYFKFYSKKIEITADIMSEEMEAFINSSTEQSNKVLIIDSSFTDSDWHAFNSQVRKVNMLPNIILLDKRNKAVLKSLFNVSVIDNHPLIPSKFFKEIKVFLMKRDGVNSPTKMSGEKNTLHNSERNNKSEVMVLVAEDNDTNCNLIKRQLDMLGYSCHVAEDGLIALEMLRQNRYSLLLTDCNMPNLDGYKLTSKIREKELAGERLPIVAVTANALQGEDENCFLAGMDDYITKPIELEKLDKIVKKWVFKCGGENLTIKNDGFSWQKNSIDFSVMKKIFGDSNEELFCLTLGDYLVSAKNIVSQLTIGFEEQDYELIESQSHKLKSSSAAVGANEIAEICSQIENSIKIKDYPQATSLRELFNRSWEHTNDFITTFLTEKE